MLYLHHFDIARTQRLLGHDDARTVKNEIKLAGKSEQHFWYHELLESSGLSSKARRWQYWRVVFYCLGACTLLLFTVFIIPILIISLLLILEYLYVRRAVYIRAVNFERDYPIFLLSLASSIRTGLDTLQALSSVQEMYTEKSEIRKELITLQQKIESGIAEEEALLQFGSTINHPDIKLFSSALVLSRKQGSSLGNCLQRLCRVTRHRQSFRRKSRAAIAMQRLSAFGIAGCSLLIGGMQVAMNSKNVLDAWHHPLGSKMLMSGICLLFLGIVWMLQLGKRRV